MKALLKILLVFTVLLPLFSLKVYAQQDTLIARDFIALQEAGKFREAAGFMDVKLREKLSPEALRQIWETLEQQFGGYRHIQRIMSTKKDSLTGVYAHLEYERVLLTLQIVFNENHRIVGYFIGNQKSKDDPQENALFPQKEDSVRVERGMLYGTLQKPREGSAAAVALIIAGSGPTDRNGNNPLGIRSDAYRMLADSLASHGIASFRYDKRGTGKSSGFEDLDKATFEDYVKDAAACMQHLKDRYPFRKYVIIGHSEGSLIGMLVAQLTDPDAFISAAGPAESIGKVFLWQLGHMPGMDTAALKTKLDSLERGYEVKAPPAGTEPVFASANHAFLASWMQYNPVTEIRNLDMPVLIIHGKNDIQIPPDEARKLASAAAQARLEIVAGMNHVLKDSPPGREGSLATYANPDLPLNKAFSQLLVDFIKKL